MDSSFLAAKVLAQRHRLPGRHVEPLNQVFGRSNIQKLPAGRTVCDEGAPAHELFVLISGRITIRKKDYQGVARDLAPMKAPSIFGHMALVGGTNRTASCVCETDCEIAWLDRRLFDTLMQEHSEQGKAFRWLLIASMLMQQGKASREIQRLSGQAANPEDEEKDLATFTASLHGW